jgi:hypothetical protein
MKIQLRYLLLVCVLLCCSGGFAQAGQGNELDALREEIRQMRSDYETRIADLEARIDAAEKKEATQA